MIKLLGRNFDSYEKAIAFLKLCIKMERSEKIRKTLEHKLGYLEIERDLAKEKEQRNARRNKSTR
jgi:hypothetical protein